MADAGEAAAKILAARPTVEEQVRDWAWQVYYKGEWCGFFRTKDTAEAWVGGRDGYEITSRRPERKAR